jgi:small subunit ribosomal protein S2
VVREYVNWQTIQLSIKKLKYLETSLTHGLLEKLPKRRCAFIETISKLDKYLGGMKNMDRIPDIVIIIGKLKKLMP